MNISGPTLRRGPLGVLAALLSFLAVAPGANAVTGHYLARSIGAGQLIGVGNVAVRSGSDVFAVDNGDNSLRRYSLSSGTPINNFSLASQFGYVTAVARVQSTGEIYVAGGDPTTGSIKVIRYAASGSPATPLDIGDITSISGVAVTSAGKLYVSDPNTVSVRAFNANGTSAGSFGNTGANPLTSVGPLTVDGAGNVYVVEYGVGVRKFNSAGTVQGTIATSAATDVAADTSNNDVFVSEAPDGVPGITRYNASGVKQQRFAEAQSFSGISVDGSTHSVFAGNPAGASGPAIDVYAPFTAPDVVTNAPPTTIRTTSADVTGTVDPNLQANTTYYFDYGPDFNYGQRTDPEKPAGSGDTPVAASGTLTGLAPNTSYHYRLVGKNNLGTNAGPDKTFTTAAAPPLVSGENAAPITPTTATLNAQVNPNNSQTTAYFEYGLTAQYGSRTTDADAGAAGTDTQVSKLIARLEPDTTYHYRVVAKNGTQPDAVGADRTFRTLPAQPIAKAGQATDVRGGSAQINGTIDTQGLAGTYSFEVTARNNPYTVTTPTRSLDAANGERSVSETLSGLPIGLTYDVRLRLETSTGPVISDPASTFVTAPDAAPPAPAPAVTTDPFPYGCITPRLTAPKGTLRPGDEVTLAGTDLGVYGAVAFGSRSAYVVRYSSSRVVVEVPSKATGRRVPITVNCGRKSNAVTARVSSTAPSNRFSTSLTVKGSSATVTVKVPGKGAVSVSGEEIGDKSAKPSKAGTVSLKVALNKSGRAALRGARSKRLRAKVTVRYRPTGGTTRSAARTLTFAR